MRYPVITLMVAGCLSSACSTRPREFRATLPEPAPDALAFERDMRTCQVLVRTGVRANFGRTAAQIGAGTAGGLAAGAAVGAAASSTLSSSLSSGIAAGGTAMTLVGPLVGFGVSRAIRSGREKKYRAALGTCLNEFGYVATGWEKQKKLAKAERAAIIAELGKAEPMEASAAGLPQGQPTVVQPPM